MQLIQFSRFFLYLTVFAVDIVLTSTFFPFIGGKYYFFRFIVELSAVFLILSWALEDSRSHIEERFRQLFRQPLFLAVSAFALMFLLASVFAHDPQAAFWSNFERGEGGFQMIHYYAFFVLLFVLLDTRDRWMTLFKCSLAAAGLMIFYGIGAVALWSPFVGPYNGMADASFFARLLSDIRFQGSLGNPAYVAPYLIFSIAFAAALWLWAKRRDVRWTAIFSVTVLFFLLFFALSQTRGAFLGLAAGTAVFVGYLIWSFRGRARQFALLALSALAVIWALLFVNRETPFVQSLPGSRFLEINVTEQTAQTRFWTWNSAWQGFKERPILGWGPENFSTVFDKYFDPRHFVPGAQTETWFDRAHSVFFDYLAETGALGVLSYLAVFAVYYYELFRFLRRHRAGRAPDHWNVIGSAAFRGLLFAIPVAYLVQGLFLFDVLPIFLNWVIVLAFVAKLTEPAHEPVRS